jgi:hypothetical protein
MNTNERQSQNGKGGQRFGFHSRQFASVRGSQVKRLDRRLSDADRKQLLKDVAFAPVWIANIIRQLAEKR